MLLSAFAKGNQPQPGCALAISKRLRIEHFEALIYEVIVHFYGFHSGWEAPNDDL